jgi:hypothetical protein
VIAYALRGLIRRFDAWLARLEGVRPFTSDPLVILRIQPGRAAWDIPLPNGMIARGSPVLFIHLWNERIPPFPAGGPDLIWARSAQRLMIYSFGSLAIQLQAQAGWARPSAVGGHIAHLRLRDRSGGRALFERLGFCLFPYHRPLGRFGEFWENVYTWCLIWAFNPPSASRHPLLGLQRLEFWMTMDDFLLRFAM